MRSTTQLTEEYISEHRSIKDCLVKGIINYSALARVMAKELRLERKTSHEAILVAARRFKNKINGVSCEEEIIRLFKNSNIDIKNNIVIYTLDKNLYSDSLMDVEKTIKKEKDLFFSIEGVKTITLIIQQKNSKLLENKFKNNIIKKRECLSLITISSPGIEGTKGAVYHISGLFFENEINIEEFMSCHHDTLIVIEAKDIDKAIKFLKF